MRKTIVFSAIAALFGLVAAAQASDHAERAMTKASQNTHVDTDDIGKAAEHRAREHTEYSVRDRDHDAYGHRREANKRGHRERYDRD